MSTKSKEGGLFNFFRRRAGKLIGLKFRLPRFMSAFLWKERNLRLFAWEYLKSKVYYENILRYRCKSMGKNFMLYGEMPYIMGNGNIYIGDNVEFHSKVTLFTGGSVYDEPELRVGDNTSIGYGVMIRVAQKVEIGKNCMIASGVIIGDNDGHPLAAERRSHALKVGEKDIKPVIIEDDVWIGEGAIVLKGVTIGRGSIVSAGSVVTKSVPPMKIVMGQPARVVMWVPAMPREDKK